MSPAEEISDIEFNGVREFLQKHCSITLAESKKYLVQTRLEGLLREFKTGSYLELIQRAKDGGDNGLLERIIDKMTTNETLWFRDRYPFEILKELILPGLAAGKESGKKIRIWSAASSTGQEPYSIAITIREFCEADSRVSPGGFEIMATDISQTALGNAKAGSYDRLEISRGMPDPLLKKYFNEKNGLWEIKEEIKRMVRFGQFNLQKPFAGHGTFDVIFCRNVMIYFSSDFKKELMRKFAEILAPDGFFVIGVSESVLGMSGDFVPIIHKGGVVYKKAPKGPAAK